MGTLSVAVHSDVRSRDKDRRGRTAEATVLTTLLAADNWLLATAFMLCCAELSLQGNSLC
jgi:hypothetical protein